MNLAVWLVGVFNVVIRGKGLASVTWNLSGVEERPQLPDVGHLMSNMHTRLGDVYLDTVGILVWMFRARLMWSLLFELQYLPTYHIVYL